MTNEQLAEIQQYATMRNAPRDTMTYGVYPNSVKALSEYQALLSWLSEHPDWQQSHADMIAAVAPHIATLQQAMQTIVAVMRAIEQAAPGTFGIQLPEESNE
jgi:hypothetical protein